MTTRFKTSVSAFALTLAIVLPFQVLPAFAADPTPAAPGGLSGLLGSGLENAAPNELKTGTETDLPKIIGGIVKALIGLIGALLFVYLLYGGFTYMTAGGDSKKVTEAVTVIKNAVIGMVIIALSYAIANFVIGSISNATIKSP